MEYKLGWPNVKGRKEIKVDDIKYGDVVAVAEYYRNPVTNEIEFGRTGLAVMSSPDWAKWYINLCKEEGRVWVNDPLPDNVMLFEPTEEEEYFGKLILLQELFNVYSDNELNENKLTDADINKYLEKEFTSVTDYIKKCSSKWGYKFWDDAIEAIAEAKKTRARQLENFKRIKKYPCKK